MLSPASLLFRYCSEEHLLSVCRDNFIRPGRATKLEVAERIVKRIGPARAWELLDEVGLGRTSLFLSLLGREAGAPKAVKLAELLTRQYSYNPFDLPDEAAGGLETGFKAAAARETDRGGLRVYGGRKARITLTSQFEVKRDWQDDYAVTELTPGDRLVATWADAAAADSIRKELFSVLGEFLTPVFFERKTLEALRAELPESSVETERVQDDKLGFSVLEATKRPEDQSIEHAPGYDLVLAGKPVIACRMYFVVPDVQQRLGLEVTQRGGLFFRSYVDPRVVRYVLSQVRGALKI